MIVKMLTHKHMKMYTWWYWHICKGGGVCRVEMGLGPSLPPAELARRDSALSGKWNAYFLLRRMQIVGENMLTLEHKLVHLLVSMYV